MIVLVGKTCSGKDSIKQELIKRGKKSIVTYTTRSRREGEIQDVTYHFIDKNSFIKMKREKFFAETTSYLVANNDIWYYGTALEDLFNDTSNTVIIVNPDGLEKIRQIDGLDFTSFYIKSKNSVIKKRLKKRGDNRKEAKRRIKADNEDFKDIECMTDFTIENNGSLSLEDIADVILFLHDNRAKGE